MPRIFQLVSLGLHAILIAILALAQLLAVGPLPRPRQPFAFDDGFIVRFVGVVPPPAPRTAVSNNQPAARDAAPIEAPSDIVPEVSERAAANGNSAREALAIENGAAGIGGIGFPGSIGAIEAGPAPMVATSGPKSREAIRLHSGVQAPRKIVDVRPVYPAIAETARVEGIVTLEAVIDVRGNVESVKVLKSIPLLDQAAVDAVRRWKFTPARLNGSPITVVMTVTVTFGLH